MYKLLMSDEFHEWLNQCPVQWFRDSYDHNQKQATYTFIEYEEG